MNTDSQSKMNICNYFFRDVELICSLGDVLKSTLDAICVSCDSKYSLNAGVGHMVRRAGGSAFLQNLNTTLRSGDVVAVPSAGCGRLRSSFVVLVPLRRAHRYCLDLVYSAIFECAKANGIHSMAVPALGTGLFGVSAYEAANFMKIALLSTPTFDPIQRIHFIDLSLTSLKSFRDVINNLINITSPGRQANSTAANGDPMDLDDKADPSASSTSVTAQASIPTTPLTHRPTSGPLATGPSNAAGPSNTGAGPSGVAGPFNAIACHNAPLILMADSAAGGSVYNNGAWTSMSAVELRTIRVAYLADEQRKAEARAATTVTQEETTMPCAICLNELLDLNVETPAYHYRLPPQNAEEVANQNSGNVVRLNVCKHMFHEKCIKAAFNVKRRCPLCMCWCVPAEGNQPLGARMQSRIVPGDVPGCDDADGYHEIRYTIPSGIQTAQHPRPRMPFSGTTRIAYLPNNAEGTVTLRLLELAFKRRLIFSVGDSVTTGRQNVVIWNDIHHKTSKHGGVENYGYPDPNYLTRVQDELSNLGIRKELLNNNSS